MTSRRGEKLTVKILRYDGAKKKFLGSGGVRMTRATSVLTGRNLIADLSMQRITVQGNVQAFIRSLALDDKATSTKRDANSPAGIGTRRLSGFPRSRTGGRSDGFDPCFGSDTSTRPTDANSPCASSTAKEGRP